MKHSSFALARKVIQRGVFLLLIGLNLFHHELFCLHYYSFELYPWSPIIS